MQEVELPDGTIVEFDDWVAPETLRASVRAYYDEAVAPYTVGESMRNRAQVLPEAQGYEHQDIYDPTETVPEQWAYAVRKTPGNILAIADEFSPFARLTKDLTGKTLQERADEFTQVNEMGYTDEDFTGPDWLRGAINLGADVVADPFLIGGVAYDAGRMVGKHAPTAFDNLIARSPDGAFKQGGMMTWQGSPHKHDGILDPSKIGTGEGAQVYGYGHYLAESPDVAKTYVPRDFDFEDELMRRYKAAESRQDYAAMQVYEDLMLHNTPDEIIERANDVDSMYAGFGDYAIELAEDIKPAFAKSQGSLYKYDLDDDAIANMLDWDDAPQEGSYISQTLMEIAEDNGWSDDMGDALGLTDMYRGQPESGETLYHLLSSLAGDEKKASQLLKEYDIPGIKYFDGQSRSAGEGTRNFVVFPGNEHLVKPLERNGEPLGLLGIGKGQKGAIEDIRPSWMSHKKVIQVGVNPTHAEFKELYGTEDMLRTFEHDGVRYAWPVSDATHDQISKHLGIKLKPSDSEYLFADDHVPPIVPKRKSLLSDFR